MAEYPKHARYARQADFDKQLSGGLIDGGTICFIEDTRQIYVNGNYYTMDDSELAEKLSGYATKEELGTKQDAFDVGYGLSLEDGVLKVTLDTSLFVVCPDGLPSEPAEGEEDKIHLVPMEETEEGNAYEEWLWVNGSWELIGTLRTKVDLSNYLPLTGGTLTGSLTVNSSTALNGGLTVNGNSVAIYGDLTVSGEVEITNDSGKPAVSIYNNVATTVHGDLTVESDVTLESKLNVGGKATFDDEVYADTRIATDGDLDVHGDTTLYLAENSDAPSVVVADDDGTLYKVPKSEIGGTDAHAVNVLRSVVSFPSSPDYGSSGSKSSAGADDIPLGDVVELTDDMNAVSLECDDGRFALIQPGASIRGQITNYYISCQEDNTSTNDIIATLRLTFTFTDGETRTVNVIAVQSTSLATHIGNYLPLSGGTIDGNLTVTGDVSLYPAETADVASEAGLLVIGTDNKVRRVTFDGLLAELGISVGVTFKNLSSVSVYIYLRVYGETGYTRTTVAFYDTLTLNLVPGTTYELWFARTDDEYSLSVNMNDDFYNNTDPAFEILQKPSSDTFTLAFDADCPDPPFRFIYHYAKDASFTLEEN